MHELKNNKIDLAKIDYIKQVSLERDKYSFNKDKKRKSSLEIYDHFLKWYLKYGEIDRYFFIMGNDVIGIDEKYYSTRLCVSLREKYNSKGKSGNYRILLDDKELFNELCVSRGISTVELLATSGQGKINWIRTPDSGEYLFIKEKYGFGGSAITTGRYLNDNKILNHKGEEIILHELVANNNKLIIEKKISQSTSLSEFNENAVNSIKLATTIRDGKVTPHFGFVRFGTEKSMFMDAWAKGAILVNLNVQTGLLEKTGYFKFPFYDPKGIGRTTVHPETGKGFDGFQIPYYEECIDLVTRAHRKFHQIYSIVWDIAITENGPLIIEGNYNWGVTIPQLLMGYEIMNEIFKNDPLLIQFFDNEKS